MALQSENIVMSGIAVPRDQRSNAAQPHLISGIHLRWAFKREQGFPWLGFYLFRRRHEDGQPLCLRSVLNNVPIGLLVGRQLDTAYGQIISDRDLSLTDRALTPTGTVVFDLADRTYLRLTFPPAEPDRKVYLRIGFL